MVTNPFRITDEFVQMIRKYHPIWINTHFNHPKELTKEAVESLAKLADGGVPLGNQTVLLRGVNDCPLHTKGAGARASQGQSASVLPVPVRLVRGHRTLPDPRIERHRDHRAPARPRVGLRRADLRGGRAGGGGKIPVGPNYILSQSPGKIVLRNYEGRVVSYPEPEHGDTHDPSKCEYCRRAQGTEEGVARLMQPGQDGLTIIAPGDRPEAGNSTVAGTPLQPACGVFDLQDPPEAGARSLAQQIAPGSDFAMQLAVELV